MKSMKPSQLPGFLLRMGMVLAGSLPMGTAFAQVTQGTGSGDLVLINPLGTSDFATVLNSVENFMIYLAIPICTIMVLVGAFKLVTSSGDPEKTKSGRNTILYAAIGFAVVILAKGVTGFIQALFVP
jgi:Type IV secretion system pilin